MNRKQRRIKKSRLDIARTKMLALSELAIANNDTIMMPKLATWEPYVCRNPKTDGARLIFDAIDRYFDILVKEVGNARI